MYFCPNQTSNTLCSLAGRAVLSWLFEACIKGTAFDSWFPFYRNKLSSISSRYMYYVGSIFVNGTHLIYYVDFVGLEEGSFSLLTDEEFYVHRGLGDRCCVIVCRGCASLTEEAVTACLHRQMRMVDRYLRGLPPPCALSVGEFLIRDTLTLSNSARDSQFFFP